MHPATRTVSRLLTAWQTTRAELAALEAADRPDITDHLGRVWTWKGRGDLYRHCGTAAPAALIERFGLPSQSALDNPNYDLCPTCIDGRTRNIPDCKPEWNCSHTMHQPTA